MSVNKVILIGNTGSDPEIAEVAGTKVAKFSLATEERYKNKAGERVTDTEWHNIVIWRGLAEVVEKYVKKGQLLSVQGKIKTRSWDDKDGKKCYMTEIICDDMQMLGRKDDAGSTPKNTAQEQPKSEASEHAQADEDDLPF